MLARVVQYVEGRLNGANDLEKEILKAAVIQNFEISYELSWKFRKRWFREQVSDAAGIDRMTRKELLHEAQKHGLIREVRQLACYHKVRCESFHTITTGGIYAAGYLRKGCDK